MYDRLKTVGPRLLRTSTSLAASSETKRSSVQRLQHRAKVPPIDELYVIYLEAWKGPATEHSHKSE